MNSYGVAIATRYWLTTFSRLQLVSLKIKLSACYTTHCEAAMCMLPPDGAEPTTVADYQQGLIKSLSTARQAAFSSISRSQKKYKEQYDRKSDLYKYRVGDWVLICFPSEETGRFRKLLRPWHRPDRITSCDDTCT